MIGEDVRRFIDLRSGTAIAVRPRRRVESARVPDRRPTLALARRARHDAGAVLSGRDGVGARDAARVPDVAALARDGGGGRQRADPDLHARNHADGALHRTVHAGRGARRARRRADPRGAAARRRGRHRRVPARRVFARCRSTRRRSRARGCTPISGTCSSEAARRPARLSRWRCSRPPRRRRLERTEQRAPCAASDPLRRPFFGDLHVHTRYSLDASTQGTRSRPSEAYAFARGEPLGLQPFSASGAARPHRAARAPARLRGRHRSRRAVRRGEPVQHARRAGLRLDRVS